ncbi:MAG: hypothetical protein COV66_06000 [Nitrospinae bacterium CG11_big_fil_rev_8_21_14_0_20_45_15]|nr:MAG: hypothetical protein COV66_06000 [Nitrospinae bacterium CG11_big_fil_rev_8_21_14_0_20_45_15]
MNAPLVCVKCGKSDIISGDIGLRTNRDKELIMVVRKYHGVEKKSPLVPLVCSSCGHVEFTVEDVASLEVSPEDKPINREFRPPPLQEYDF